MATYRPPRGAASAARRALEVRADKPKSQRAMTPVGLARARDLSNRANLSLATVRRMLGYFSRHLPDKDGTTWGEQGKGWQAWHGWGGDAGHAGRSASSGSMTANGSIGGRPVHETGR